MAEFVPPALTGVWRREVLTAPGRRDDTTRVFWLQTRSWYADIRVKADRPLRAAAGFADYDDAELVKLAASQGFCLSRAGTRYLSTMPVTPSVPSQSATSVPSRS